MSLANRFAAAASSPKSLLHAAARIDGQRQIQGHIGFPLEDCDLLRPVVLEHGKIVFGQGAYDRPVLVCHVYKDVHQLHVNMERGLLG